MAIYVFEYFFGSPPYQKPTFVMGTLFLGPLVLILLMAAIKYVYLYFTRENNIRKLEAESFLAAFGGFLKEYNIGDDNVFEMVLKSKRKEINYPRDTQPYCLAVDSLIFYVDYLKEQQEHDLKITKSQIRTDFEKTF